jgi:hypothetical protein
MKQVRLLWLLLLIYGFAIADLSQKVLWKLDRGFNRGWTSGMNRGFEPLFYIQSFAVVAASLGAALTLWQLWRIHVQHLTLASRVSNNSVIPINSSARF